MATEQKTSSVSSSHQLEHLRELEKALWNAADELRANSKLTPAEYTMPVLGILFLRQAHYRLVCVEQALLQKSRKAPENGTVRAVDEAELRKHAVLYLPPSARYPVFLNLPDEDLASALNAALRLVEQSSLSLCGVFGGGSTLDYRNLNVDLLKRLVEVLGASEFDVAMKQAHQDDVFGRIYEFFLNKFAMSGAQEGGEFFTPPSLVRLIVQVIEPFRGIVIDPACGSGGMFVHTKHALAAKGKSADKITFVGRERAELNANLARMNLAVHGLVGEIKEANSFYDFAQDAHLIGACDYAMANPPFNVDKIMIDKIEKDPRISIFPATTGKSSQETVGNGNYLWIQYFYAYLNKKGRAGFVMAQSTPDSGGKDKAIRQHLINTGHVDIMVMVGKKFFYTRSLPCSVWFFDKGKPKSRLKQILMLDLRQVYKQVSRNLRAFSDVQLQRISAIVWLYRGQKKRYLELIQKLFFDLERSCAEVQFTELDERCTKLERLFAVYFKYKSTQVEKSKRGGGGLLGLRQSLDSLQSALAEYDNLRSKFAKALRSWSDNSCLDSSDNEQQHKIREGFESLISICVPLRGVLLELSPKAMAVRHCARKKLSAYKSSSWDDVGIKDELESIKTSAAFLAEKMDSIQSIFEQIKWLHARFPEAKINDCLGLCKVVSIKDIENNDWSLNPGRYVGSTPIEHEDEDQVAARLKEIHLELEELNKEAIRLAQAISDNFKSLML